MNMNKKSGRHLNNYKHVAPNSYAINSNTSEFNTDCYYLSVHIFCLS